MYVHHIISKNYCGIVNPHSEYVQKHQLGCNLHIAQAISWGCSLLMVLMPNQFKDTIRFDCYIEQHTAFNCGFDYKLG